jgi:peptidoglycan/LPS O-acetylase OafA/YrhL
MVQLTPVSAGEFSPNPALVRALSSGSRIPQLDELRGLALLMVLAYHAFGVLNYRNDLRGDVGVDIFLIVSGFSLSVAGAAQGPWQFARRRLARLVPGYWLALLLFLVAGHFILRRDWSGADVACHVLGIHGLVLGRPEYFLSINDSFWFISILALVYPAFYLARGTTGAVRLLALGAAGALALAAAYKLSGNEVGLWHLPLRFFSFFVGASAARMLQFPGAAVRISAWDMAAIVMLCFAAFRGLVVLAYPAAALGLCLLYCALRAPLARLAIGRSAIAALAGAGTVSYELYLLHQPLMRDYAVHFLRQLGWEGNAPALALGMALGLAFAIVLSVALHILLRRLWSKSWK